ncbi:MAG: tetratricopeptide repeat protein, partial [Candidatus Latescibacteria bacterium]|nr:tetratricopeptide repeat protein [Candidatus Latescibacterota bacterium]
LGAGIAVLTAWIGARVFGRRVGLAAGYGAALYGMLIYFDGELLTPTLTIALQLVAIALVLRAGEGPGPSPGRWSAWRHGAAGFAGGLASITTATSLVVVAVLAAFARRRALPVLLGAAVAIAPITWRNAVKGGELIPISWNAGINFYIGNNPNYDETVGIRPDLQWKHFVQEPLRLGIRGMGAASSYFVRKSLSYLASDPIGFAKLQVRKLYLLLEGNEIPRNQEIYPSREYSPVFRFLVWKVPGLAFPFGVLAPLGLVGLVAAWRRGPMLAAVLVAYACAVLAFFITARYRMPLVPLLLIFASEGVRWFRSEARAAPRAAAAAGAAFLFLAANLGQGPMPARMNADAEYSLGVKLALKGRADEAMGRIEAALRERPDYAEAWVNLGVLQATHGRPADAERSLTRALEQEPEDIIALTNLAVLREKAGRTADAVALYERAARLDPADEFTRRKLAELRRPSEPAQPRREKPQ